MVWVWSNSPRKPQGRDWLQPPLKPKRVCLTLLNQRENGFNLFFFLSLFHSIVFQCTGPPCATRWSCHSCVRRSLAGGRGCPSDAGHWGGLRRPCLAPEKRRGAFDEHGRRSRAQKHRLTTAGRRADLQLVKEHSQLQARQKSIANCRQKKRA